MEEQFGNSTSPCSVGSKHSNLKKSFKMGIRSMLTTCSKEDFLKAFSSFNKSKQDVLYHLFIRVITSLHQSIEEHFESICLEAQVGATLDTVEKLVEEQTQDILFNDEINILLQLPEQPRTLILEITTMYTTPEKYLSQTLTLRGITSMAWLITVSLAICKAFDLMDMLKKEEEILSAVKEKQLQEGEKEVAQEVLDERIKTAEAWHRNAATRSQFIKPAQPITCATFAQDVVEGRAKI